jgi:hypothetical protein
MVRFGIPDCPIFLSCLLLADTSVMVVSCVVAPVAKTSQVVLAISGGSALAMESTDCTTPAKEDKTDTSSAQAPTA